MDILSYIPAWDTVYLGNSLRAWAVALATLAGGLVLIFVLQRFIFRRIEKVVQSTSTRADDHIFTSLRSRARPVLFFTLLYISLQGLHMPEQLSMIVRVIALVAISYFVVKFLLDVIIFFLRKRLVEDADESRLTAFQAIRTLLQITAWAVALLIVLDNLGIKISGLLTGLGIGGIAVAFAAQALLGDIFSYFSIFMDRPFEVGDFLIIGDYMGTVEKIGIKTTRIRSLQGEELVFSNTDLTSSRIRNYRRMKERRVNFKLGVTYETGSEKLEMIPGIVKEIIDSIDGLRFDRAHFEKFGDFSLIFEIVYYLDTSDYYKYMDHQQQINLAIYRRFEEAGIEFAFPTQELRIPALKGKEA